MKLTLGNSKMVLFMQDNIQHSRPGSIFLVEGVDADNKPQYAYVLINAEKYPEFLRINKMNSFNLLDYGEILHSDRNFPSIEVKNMMKEKYNADFDFEQKVINLLKNEP